MRVMERVYNFSAGPSIPFASFRESAKGACKL